MSFAASSIVSSSPSWGSEAGNVTRDTVVWRSDWGGGSVLTVQDACDHVIGVVHRQAAHQHDGPFERYADDVVAHCDTEEQARLLRATIATRLRPLGLELHPDKTEIVYAKTRTAEPTRSTPASTTSATPSGAALLVASTATL
jgi:hypothetical protein